MKRFFIIIIIILSLGSALIYWTQPDRRSPVPVLYWVTQNDDVKLEAIELFKTWLRDNNLPPVEVKIDNANQDPTKKLAQGLAGVGADLFDIHPVRTELFASSGMLMDVTEAAIEMGFSPAATYPAIKSDLVVDGRQYGFTRNVAGAMCWINTETFARHGVPEPNYRWTWDEFEELGVQFVTAANPPGTRERSYFVQAVSPIQLRRSLGLSYFNETMTGCTLDDPRNAEVLRRIYRWTRELRLIPTVAERGAMSAEGSRAGDAMFYLFAHGRFAMLALPRWAFIMLRVQGELPMRVVEPFHGGFPNIEFGTGMLAVYSGTKHPQEALRFLQFLTSEPFNLLVASSGDSLPPVPRYVHTDEFMRPPDHPGEWEMQKVFATAAPEIGITMVRSLFVITGVFRRIDGQMIQAVLADRLTPEEAGRFAAEQINAAIQQKIRHDVKLRQKYEELVKVQAQIDERRVQGLRVPAAWISNPFHLAYYKAKGWLEEEPQP